VSQLLEDGHRELEEFVDDARDGGGDIVEVLEGRVPTEDKAGVGDEGLVRFHGQQVGDVGVEAGAGHGGVLAADSHRQRPLQRLALVGNRASCDCQTNKLSLRDFWGTLFCCTRILLSLLK